MRGELCTTRAPAKVDQAARYSGRPDESSELPLLFLLRTLHRILRCRFTSRSACWKSQDGPRQSRLSRNSALSKSFYCGIVPGNIRISDDLSHFNYLSANGAGLCRCRGPVSEAVP